MVLFERFTVCSAKMDESIDGKASNRRRYTLSVEVTREMTPRFLSLRDGRHATPMTVKYGVLESTYNLTLPRLIVCVCVNTVKAYCPDGPNTSMAYSISRQLLTRQY